MTDSIDADAGFWIADRKKRLYARCSYWCHIPQCDHIQTECGARLQVVLRLNTGENKPDEGALAHDSIIVELTQANGIVQTTLRCFQSASRCSMQDSDSGRRLEDLTGLKVIGMSH